MIRYHVSSRTGEAGICNAMFSCPFGSEADHFPTMVEARAESEKRLAEKNKDNQFSVFHQPPAPGTDARVSDGTEESRINAYYADRNLAAKFAQESGLYEIQLDSVKKEGYQKGKPSKENLEKLYKMKKNLVYHKDEIMTKEDIYLRYSSAMESLEEKKRAIPKIPARLLPEKLKKLNTEIIIWEVELMAERDARITNRTLSLT